jgi:type III secretion protein S
MNEADLASILSKGLSLTLWTSMPAIVVAAGVGTLFSLLQALTQVQEQTLSFAVKLLAVGMTLFLAARWMGGEIYNFTLAIFENLPNLVR